MCFAFGEYVLDTKKQELSRQGEVIPLEPKAYEVLKYLIDNRDHLVSKQELLSNVWADVYVDDTAVARYVHLLREKLADDLNIPWAIQTRRGRGYRFIAQVQKVEPPVPMPKGVQSSSPTEVSREGVASNGASPVARPHSVPIGILLCCPTCSSKNPVPAKFCKSCGAALRMLCPQCEHQVVVPAAYCLGCGERLGRGSAEHGRAQPGSPRSRTNGEETGLMTCTECSHTNVRWARYCRTCGATLNAICSICGQANVVPATYCPHCSYRLG